MKKLFITTLLALATLGCVQSAHAQGYFGVGFGATSFGTGFAPIRTHRFAPPARYDASIDPSLIRAASIADHRAESHSTLKCWRYVKEALVNAGAVRSYPTTAYASQAGDELTSRHGFVQLHTRNPYSAPVGSVIVYGGHGAGHVELRTSHGFVSDFRSSTACRYRVIGIYAKMAG